MDIVYQPMFLRRLKALTPTVQATVIAKVLLFADLKNHQTLGVHKLHGRLKDRYGFSVTPSIRIVFCYTTTKPREAHLLTVGPHDVYDT
ncbi:TPA: hypothetical protein DEP96_04025 [Candidatus Uhrbacteria bacterium]|nr:hypothetical protein [Candidatus Uhrbacteria bacterium]